MKFLALFGLLTLSVAVQAENDRPRVELTTDEGAIVLELFPDKAPITVSNFLQYVDDGYYDGTIFHRVIPGFVVQGGGLTYDFTRKPPRDPIANESDNGLSNKPMTLAMARHSDPDSATSQFYINLNHNPGLDATEERPGYTVFGQVVDGYDTIITIVQAPKGNYKQFPDAPNVPIRILEARRLPASADTTADGKESAQ
ncbi:peptidylprolyl isomerase [Marinimicrobium sp. LS-A18]|uniref:peptidylprolyl isomerase n=1 Tax=Marinimicrobium sp. LS-A18 TaxID=1381596 RepID=UPI00046544B2|nr:peptidylprolyl isomerase [Marinimicrobium sp. LS-A18]